MNRLQTQFLLAAVLALLVTASGIWLTYAKHEARRLFVELEELNREHDRLQIDWDRLLLEQSAWATHSRIEMLASESLDLAMPRAADVIVIAEPER